MFTARNTRGKVCYWRNALIAYILRLQRVKGNRNFKYIFIKNSFPDPHCSVFLILRRDVSSTQGSEQARARLGLPRGCGSQNILNVHMVAKRGKRKDKREFKAGGGGGRRRGVDVGR